MATKKRKKKNVKMRRQIWKTVSAILMIMAIVVAAIPVERYGRMEASTTPKDAVDLADVYSKYLDYYYDDSNYKKYYFGNDFTNEWSNYNKVDYVNRTDEKVTASISESGSSLLLEWTYLYKDKQNTSSADYEGIIVGYNPNKVSDDVTIESTANQDAWIITPGFRNAFKDTLAPSTNPEKYTYSYTPGDVTYNYDFSTTPTTIPAQITPSNVVVSAVSNISSAWNTNFANAQEEGAYHSTGGTKQLYEDWYGNNVTFIINSMSTTLADELCKKTNSYQNWINDINSFNAKQSELAAKLSNVATDTELNNLNNDITTLRNQYNNIAQNLELTVEHFDEETLSEMICARLTIKKGNETIPLEKFKLQKVQDRIHYSSSTSDVYYSFVPKLRDDVDPSVANNFILDSNNFLMTGMVTLAGIGNEVFKGDTTITSVTLADSFNFIGNSAFETTNLQSIYMKYVKQIGNRAFYKCQQLKEVLFTGTDANSSSSAVNYIGAQAFDGTAITNLIIPNSVDAIGPGAFANCTSLKNIDFNITRDLEIWPFAFYENIGLESYSFPSSNQYNSEIKMGLAAFAVSGTNGGGALEEFQFPYMKNNIVAGTTDFEKSTGAFYGSLSSISSALGDNYQNEFMYNYILAGRSGLKHVIFPANMGANYTSSASPERIPDDTLAYCTELEYVTMGSCGNYQNTDCIGITYDTPNTSSNTTNDKDGDGHTLFQDITNTSFYVEGPGYYADGKTSNPRKVTWTAQTARSDSVPYKFYDRNGDVNMEVATDKYIACFAVIDENAKTARLVSYDVLDTSDTTSPLGKIVIGEDICGYSIVEVKAGCFEPIARRVQELEIADYSIQSLEAEAFKDCTKLSKVTIGNSVKEIGQSAFEGCTMLENVYFHTPQNISDVSETEAWAAALTIGTDAFKTNSSYLTFHGPIHSGYEPFEYAMGDNTTGSGRRNICYKTDEPKNLMVLRDNVTGLPTLIDYPHYEEIDLLNEEFIQKMKKDYNLDPSASYSIIEKWENYAGVKEYPYYANDTFGVVTDEENNIVESTLFIDLPDGIKAIDVKGYFTNGSENSQNKDYFTRYYAYNADNDYVLDSTASQANKRKINKDFASSFTDVYKLYTDDNESGDDKANPKKAGLYSGYFSESLPAGAGALGLIGKTMNFASRNIEKDMVEEVETGNDHLLSMTLHSVQDLPDYAFNSCENLVQIDLGSDLGMPNMARSEPDTIVMPFRGCTGLNSVTFAGAAENEYYKYANGILYRIGNGINGIEAGKLEIVEVLEGRGNERMTTPFDISSSTIDETKDPLLTDVVKIAPEAFSFNNNVRTIDLSKTAVSEIPENCFKGTKNLQFLTLPETLETVGKNAFAEHGDSYLNIYFNDPNVIIDTSAFDNDFRGCFHGEEWATSEHNKKSGIYNFANSRGNIDWDASLNKYKVRLFDFDADLLAVVSVEEGKNLTSDGFDLAGLESSLTRAGYTFKGWAWDKDGDLTTKGDTVTGNEVMQNVKEDRVLVAQYEPNSVVGDDQDHTLTVKNGVITSANASTATIKGGAAVAATAFAPASGYTFVCWTSDEIAIPESQRYSMTVSFVMPNKDATITATYRDSNGNTTTDGSASTGTPGSSNSGNGGSNNGSDNNDNKDGKYKLTVNYGSGSGNYDAGKSVTITAYAPEAKNKVFSHWSTSSSEVAFASTTSATTTLVMPKKDVTVTANYKTRSSSDDDDDDDDDDRDAWNKRHDSTTATTNRNVNTGTTANTGTTGNTGANTQTTPDSGTRLDIQSNGISNKDMGSANVSGSTDNFVIKISDSADAKAAVEAALIDKYGSLDGLAYFPMDISLYDPSGKNKVTDTSGLSVSITIPIPDELIQYGGNNLAGAVNRANKMEDLVARFTTIDGIGCITFTATHFSPYAIYVDTNNLVAGQTLDATPKTGDGIHPKWFLAIALACMSVVVFMVSDKKRVRTAI